MPCDVGWTHLYTVCSHVLDTVARPFFSICLLWRHNPSFLLKQECRPAPGPLHTTSLEMDKFASLTDVPPLSALPIYDLYQSTPLTPQHIMPVWPLGERMSLDCSVFWGLTPGMHANAGEKFRRCTSVGDWDWYILFDCKGLQQSDQLLAQKGQSRDTEKQFNRLA